MLKTKLLPPLIALAALMLVVSGTLAAVLISDDGGKDESSSRSAATEASPTATAMSASAPGEAPSETPSATPEPESPIPEPLRGRFAALPQQLQDQVLDQLADGSVGASQVEHVIEAYENRNKGVRVGSVLETGGDSLSMEIYTTGEQVDILVNSETVIRRAQEDISLASLEREELVMVVSMDEGVTAFSIEAFGVEAP